MARRECNVARNGRFGRLAKSAGFRRNPQQHAGTGANRQEKAPTDNSWGFSIGGGNADLPQNSLKARAPRNSLIINAEVILHNLSGKKQDGKFWIGEASPVGLTLKWGKPDTVGQQHFIPAENCEGNNSVMELEARAEKKIKEGYSLNTTKSSF